MSALKWIAAALFGSLALAMLVLASVIFVLAWSEPEGAREWWLLFWWPFATVFVVTFANLALRVVAQQSAFWLCILVSAITYVVLLFLDIADAPAASLGLIITANAVAWVNVWLFVNQQGIRDRSIPRAQDGRSS